MVVGSVLDLPFWDMVARVCGILSPMVCCCIGSSDPSNKPFLAQPFYFSYTNKALIPTGVFYEKLGGSKEEEEEEERIFNPL